MSMVNGLLGNGKTAVLRCIAAFGGYQAGRPVTVAWLGCSWAGFNDFVQPSSNGE